MASARSEAAGTQRKSHRLRLSRGAPARAEGRPPPGRRGSTLAPPLEPRAGSGWAWAWAGVGVGKGEGHCLGRCSLPGPARGTAEASAVMPSRGRVQPCLRAGRALRSGRPRLSRRSPACFAAGQRRAGVRGSAGRGRRAPRGCAPCGGSLRVTHQVEAQAGGRAGENEVKHSERALGQQGSVRGARGPYALAACLSPNLAVNCAHQRLGVNVPSGMCVWRDSLGVVSHS